MTIRVLRVLEYEYPNAETMIADMERWGVPANGTSPYSHSPIRSSTFPPQVVHPAPDPRNVELAKNHGQFDLNLCSTDEARKAFEEGRTTRVPIVRVEQEPRGEG